MKYKSIRLSEPIAIKHLYTVHYFEYTSQFFFPGEIHDFWELVYVDKGKVVVTADSRSFILKKGEVIFHQPGEFHSLEANGSIAPNLVVMAFACQSMAMDYLKSQVFRVTDYQQELLARVVSEARQAYSSPLDDPQLTVLKRQTSLDRPFAGEQIIKISLEALLIDLIRQQNQTEEGTSVATAFRRQSELDLYSRTIAIFEENLFSDLTIDQMCAQLHTGRSRLQKLFRARTGGGLMAHFNQMKIEMAKNFIREGDKTMTEIAECLGYSSLYYFSRQFKRVVGMSPTEYGTSIKMKTITPYVIK